jgi:hypothetical protein
MSAPIPSACHALQVFRPRIIVYATIIQLASFAVYVPGPVPFTVGVWINFILVSFAPMIAVGVAHTFSDLLDMHIQQGSRFRWDGLQPLFASNLQFLYVGTIPVIITAPFLLGDVDGNSMVNLVFVAGLLSLFGWGFYAAQLSGRRLRARFGYGFGYAFAGLLVTILELYLRHS